MSWATIGFLILNARYDLGKELAASGSWAAGTYIGVGAVNLFNKQPQFSYSYGYDAAEADIRGRIIYLDAGVKF